MVKTEGTVEAGPEAATPSWEKKGGVSWKKGPGLSGIRGLSGLRRLQLRDGLCGQHGDLG